MRVPRVVRTLNTGRNWKNRTGDWGGSATCPKSLQTQGIWQACVNQSFLTRTAPTANNVVETGFVKFYAPPITLKSIMEYLSWVTDLIRPNAVKQSLSQSNKGMPLHHLKELILREMQDINLLISQIGTSWVNSL